MWTMKTMATERHIAVYKADPQVADIMRIAAKAEALDLLCNLLGEIELLERDFESLRKSKAKDVDFRRVHFDGRLQQARHLVKQIRERWGK